MIEKNEEVFPIEFRHEVVTKFAKQFIDGSIKLELDGVKAEGQAGIASTAMVRIANGVREYFANNLTSGRRSEIEHELFTGIALARLTGIIHEVHSQSEMEKEVEVLHSKIDSTNSLLAELLKILKELVNRLDN
jgi:hypothetical protein